MSVKDSQDLSEILKYLKAEMPKMQDSFVKIDEKLGKLERAVYGDPVNLVPGILELNRQEQLEIQKLKQSFKLEISKNLEEVSNDLSKIDKRVDKIESLKQRILWVATGIGIGSGIGGASIMQYFTTLK